MNLKDRITELLARSGIPACAKDDPIYNEPPTITFINRPGKAAAAPASPLPGDAPTSGECCWLTREDIAGAIAARTLAGLIAQGMPPKGFRAMMADDGNLAAACWEELRENYGWREDEIAALFT